MKYQDIQSLPKLFTVFLLHVGISKCIAPRLSQPVSVRRFTGDVEIMKRILKVTFCVVSVCAVSNKTELSKHSWITMEYQHSTGTAEVSRNFRESTLLGIYTGLEHYSII